MIGENNTIIEKIEINYSAFSSILDNPIIIADHESKMNWYLSNPHKQFNEVKSDVNDLMNLNDKTMFQTASELQNKSNRAVMPGIVSILAAIVFSLIFTYLVNYYFINPIIKMTNSVREFVDHSTPYKVTIESNDEINELSRSIETLCQLTKSVSVNR